MLTQQYSYPCEDGELDLIKDASLSLAAHGQYMCVTEACETRINC